MSSIWIALVIDLLWGDPQWFPHPVRLIGKYITGFERRVRRFRLDAGGLKIAGMILTLSTVISAYGVVWGILWLTGRFSVPLSGVINILFLWTCISPRCLQQEAAKIYDLLRVGDLALARKELSYIVGRDTGDLDEPGIVRAVVETVAENTSDGVIAPLFYMFIGGAPLAMAYKAVNTLDSMVGYRKEFYADFGWSSAKTDDGANYIPARLSALFLLLATVPLRLDFRNCFRVLRRDRCNHTSPNSAYPEAAVAGALNIRLGGASTYGGNMVAKPTLGDAVDSLNREHIGLTNRMMGVATMWALVFFSAIIGMLRGLS